MLLYFLVLKHHLDRGKTDRPIAYHATSYIMAGSIAIVLACLLFNNFGLYEFSGVKPLFLSTNAK